MVLNKQDIPELEEEVVFTAILPSREKLLEMFREEEDDPCIKEFIEEISTVHKEYTMQTYAHKSYTMETYISEGEAYGVSYIKPGILEGDTLLLCQQLSRKGTAPFGRSLVLAILHSDVVASTSAATRYFGFAIPIIYNGFLINITRVSSGIIV